MARVTGGWRDETRPRNGQHPKPREDQLGGANPAVRGHAVLGSDDDLVGFHAPFVLALRQQDSQLERGYYFGRKAITLAMKITDSRTK
jgi:hypothetical protein